jgi:hypothetical protein
LRELTEKSARCARAERLNIEFRLRVWPAPFGDDAGASFVRLLY